MESQKSSSRRATFQRKKEAGEGRRERETKQNAFDERGKREFKREREREREFAYLDDDGGLDGLHCIKGKRLTLFVVEKVKEQS
jgi:hypothetical protein